MQEKLFHVVNSFLGFSTVIWNYTEAGHGKGAPDGIGAVIKREADRLVLHSSDISGGDQLFKLLTERNLNIQIFTTKEEDFVKFSQLLSSVSLTTVPGTMKTHQSLGEVSFRDVSCFCQTPSFCGCYSPEKTTIYKADRTTNPAPGVLRFPAIDESLVGQYCVVTYDDQPYPGIIQTVDSNEIEVNVMHSVGDNRFFWPRIDDVLRYTMDKVVTLISPPKKITRHFEVDKDIWREIKIA